MGKGIIGVLSVVKIILTVLVLVVLLVGCSRIYNLTKGTDSGSVKSLKSLENVINFMRDRDKLKDNPISINDFYLAESYFIVGFDRNSKFSIGVGRPIECSLNFSCVVMCSVEDSCSSVVYGYFNVDSDVENFLIASSVGLVTVNVLKEEGKIRVSKKI